MWNRSACGRDLRCCRVTGVILRRKRAGSIALTTVGLASLSKTAVMSAPASAAPLKEKVWFHSGLSVRFFTAVRFARLS